MVLCAENRHAFAEGRLAVRAVSTVATVRYTNNVTVVTQQN